MKQIQGIFGIVTPRLNNTALEPQGRYKKPVIKKNHICGNNSD